MEPILGSSVCLICFQMTEKHIFVPSDAPEKLFNNCNKYLHSTLTKGTLNDIQLPNENQVPLCKSCFDSALELTQLSEQLTTIEKYISDLSEAFSMAVFHRRSQVYSNQNIDLNKNNQEMDINDLYLQSDISNVKCESSDILFDNLSGNPQQSSSNGDIVIKIKKENLDEQCGQSTIEQNQNFRPVGETRIVQVAGRNDSKKCAYSKNEVKLTMSDLLKTVKMPKIILERINIVGKNTDVSVVNQTNCETRQKNLDETFFKDDEFSVQSFGPEIPGDGKLLKCFYCKKTFAQECHRTIHHKTHTGDINKRSLGKQKCIFLTHKGKKPFYKCSYCEKGFSKPSSVRTHERTHSGCKNRFINKPHLKHNEGTHTGEKPFKCSFCNKRSTEKCNLNVHERTHTGEKPFKCSFCNARFNSKSNLKVHERIHTGEKPFECSVCSVRFSDKSSQIRHERTHTGQQPFKCSFCNKRFNLKNSLKRHERIHTGEKPFKCSFCNKRFTVPGSLKLHERIHTGEKPFKCSFCSTRFSDQSSLVRHERIHTGEKPFKCSVCKDQFRQSSLLRRHEKLHTKEKPYKCLHCEKTFSRRSDKDSHQKCHPEQMSSLISQSGTQKDGSLAHLKHQEKMHFTGPMELKCSFCEIIFSQDEERVNHEKIHRREDEIVNENIILGI